MSEARHTNGALATVTALFFMWGFITSLIDPLVAAVKSIFRLSNVEAQLSTFAFFIAYGVVSIPAAALVSRLGAIRSIVVALGLMVAGCLVILAASNAALYEGVLVGLFVLASGITILQVAANPLAALLGPPERSHFRLTLSQAFNALGTVLGPLLGASLLLRGLTSDAGPSLQGAARSDALHSIDIAFLIIAAMIVVLGLFIWSMRLRIEQAATLSTAVTGVVSTIRQILASPAAMLGGAAIFLYVGAEVSIGTQMALFLHDAAVWDIPLQSAGYYVSLYWLGAMIGRFFGSGLMVRFPAYRLLAAAAACAVILCFVAFLITGVNAGYAVIAIGLFNSIMFPAIFSLTLERSTATPEATSGYLCTAIVGGALVPLLTGAVSDTNGYATSFIVPMTCYVLLFAFAIFATRGRPEHSQS